MSPSRSERLFQAELKRVEILGPWGPSWAQSLHSSSLYLRGFRGSTGL